MVPHRLHRWPWRARLQGTCLLQSLQRFRLRLDSLSSPVACAGFTALELGASVAAVVDSFIWAPTGKSDLGLRLECAHNDSCLPRMHSVSGLHGISPDASWKHIIGERRTDVES